MVDHGADGVFHEVIDCSCPLQVVKSGTESDSEGLVQTDERILATNVHGFVHHFGDYVCTAAGMIPIGLAGMHIHLRSQYLGFEPFRAAGR